MALIHATTAITLSPLSGRKQAVGKSTKWNWKLLELARTPLREHKHL
jgi:hypothetical protein